MYEFFTAILRHFTTLAPWRVLGIDKCGALTRAAAKHTPRKSKQRNDRKTKPKARRRVAVPANPLGDRLPLFRRAWLSTIGFCRSLHLLNLPFRSGYGSIVPRGRQRPQNRRLKHLYKRIESRVRIVSLLGSFAVYKAFADLYATILPLSR